MLIPNIPELIEKLQIQGVPNDIVTNLESILYRSNRNQIENLVKCLYHLANETKFFSAPASSKYHGNKPFGLIRHSILVTENLLKLKTALGVELEDHDCVIVGLLHDAGKAGLPGVPYYLPTENEKKPYETNKDIPFLTVAQRSLYLVANVYGMPLTPEQYQAILIHDGLYCEENQAYKGHECKLALLLHHADAVAAFVFEV